MPVRRCDARPAVRHGSGEAGWITFAGEGREDTLP